VSESKVSRLRQGYEALAKRDLETLDAVSAELLAPDFELHTVLLGQTFRGTQWGHSFLSAVDEAFEDYRLELSEIIDLDTHVIVVVLVHAHRDGEAVEECLASVWRFEGEIAVDARVFMSKAAAMGSIR
jgi:ketosteroid isomerase-like protein